MKNTLLITLIIFLAGCSTTGQVYIVTATSQPTVTLMPKDTPIHPAPSFTPTLSPTKTLTPSPTWTPLPTLVNQAGFLNLISFTKNSVCKFPCLAGITPGKTTWDEAVFALRPVAAVAKLNIVPNQESSYGPVNTISWYLYGGEFEVEGKFLTGSNANLVWMRSQSFSIPTGNIPSHSLPLLDHFNMHNVLNEYGVPSMVYINTFVHDRPGPILFKVLMVYPEHQFYVEYYRHAKLSSDNIVACDSAYYTELLVVDNKDKLDSAESIVNAPETKELNIQKWKPVEKALKITPVEFYEIYRATSSECMISPKSVWLP